MADSLRNKTIKGVGWSAADNVAQYAASFIIGIILARILSPDDYGLIGIITAITVICQPLINSGFTYALIRKKDVTNDDYNTVFLINLIVSIVLYCVLFLIAPLIASFFGRSELTALTRVLCIVLIVGGLALVQRTRLTKQLDFRSQTVITLVSTVLSGIVGVSMAFGGYGVWALVAQNIVLQVTSTALLWLYNKWIPKLRFSKASFHELFGFSWKLMAVNMIDNLWKEMTQFVVGKFYSPAALGQYSRARGFSQILSTNLTSVVQRVTYPVLSTVQDDRVRMVAIYRKMIKTTMFITSISLFLLGAVSEPFIYCLIGPKWHEATIYLPFICIASSLYPLHSINLNMLQVLGRSDLFLKLEIIKKTIAIVPLLVGAFVGILPMLYVQIIVSIISFFLNSYYTGKFLNYNSWMQIKDILPSYGVAITIAMMVYPLKYLSISYWLVLLFQGIVGMVSCLAISQLFHLEPYQELKAIAEPFVKKIFKR